jgi:hypothetical protein
MGRQVRFLANSDDAAALEAEARARGAVFLAYYHQGTEPRLVTDLTAAATTEPIVWLTRAEDLPRVRLTYIEAQGYWLVDQLKSPVLEWSGSGTEQPPGEHEVRSGRLWFATGTYDSHGERIPFGDFVDGAQSMLAWVRRQWSYDRSGARYIGPGAAAHLTADSVELPPS